MKRSPEEIRAAERACLEGLRDIQARRSVRVDGRVVWSPLKGMSAEVKIFKVVDGRVDPTPAAQEVTDSVMHEVHELCARHHCALMPVLIVVGESASVQIVTIAEDKLAPRHDDDPDPDKPDNEDSSPEEPS